MQNSVANSATGMRGSLTQLQAGFGALRAGIGAIGLNAAFQLGRRALQAYRAALDDVITRGEAVGASDRMRGLANNARELRDNMNAARGAANEFVVVLATGARHLANMPGPVRELAEAFNIPRQMAEGTLHALVATLRILEGLGVPNLTADLDAALNAGLNPPAPPPGFLQQLAADTGPYLAQLNSVSAMVRQIQQQHVNAAADSPWLTLERQLAASNLPSFIQDGVRAFAEMARAQREAAAQNERLMAGVRDLARQADAAVTPFERIRNRVSEIMGQGLNPMQEARLLGDAMRGLPQIPRGQLSGAVRAGSAEDVTVRNEAMARRLDGGPVDRVRQQMDLMREQHRREVQELQAIREAIQSGEFRDIFAGGGAG
jgi:hypothetical protein